LYSSWFEISEHVIVALEGVIFRPTFQKLSPVDFYDGAPVEAVDKILLFEELHHSVSSAC
jgi:hypothetical protein